MERVLIKNLEENELSKISGMIKTIRNTKYMIFIKLKDRTGYIQVSVDKIKEYQQKHLKFNLEEKLKKEILQIL